MNKNTSRHWFSRRRMLRGLGVSMALPWMESVPVWGDEPRGNQSSSEAPVRLAVLFSGNGFHSKQWWAKGEGRAMEFGEVLAPLAGLPVQDHLRARAIQRGGAEGQHPQLANRQSFVGSAIGIGRRNPIRHQHRPASRSARWQFDEGTEPGSRLREVESFRPQELFDALQLPHIVELARRRQRRWKSTPLSRSTDCSKTRQVKAIRAFWTRCSQTRRVCAATSARAINASSMNISTQFGMWNNGLRTLENEENYRAGGQHSPNRM